MSQLRSKILLCLFFLFPLWFSLAGAIQSRMQTDRIPQETSDSLRIINADVTRFDKRVSTARRLIGNVVFYHDSVTMYCDSAWHYDEEQRIEAFGNIRIVRDNSAKKIYGDYLVYDGKTKLAQLWDNVKAVDSSSILTTTSLYYDLNDEVIYYNEKAHIVHKDSTTLDSRVGKLFTRENFAWFYGSVEAKNPEYNYYGDTLAYNMNTNVAEFYGPSVFHILKHEDTLVSNGGWINAVDSVAHFYQDVWLYGKQGMILADTLHYNNINSEGYARNNIVVIDTANSVIAEGNYCIFSVNPNSVILTNNAVVKYWEKTDTLYLHADTLKMFTKTITIKDSTAIADSSNIDIVNHLAKSDSSLIDNNSVPIARADSSVIDIREAIAIEDSSYVDLRKPNARTDKSDNESIIPIADNNSITNVIMDSLVIANDFSPDSINHLSIMDSIDTDVSTSLSIVDSSYIAKDDSVIISKPSYLVTSKDSTYKELMAYNHVKFYRFNIQGKCDSLYFATSDSIVRLFKGTVLWSNNQQVSADSAKLFIANKQPQRMELYEKPFITSQEGSTDFFNQIKGINITIFFSNNKLSLVNVKGNAESIYFANDEDEIVGGNKIKSENMNIYFEDGEAESVLFSPQSQGKLTPIDKIDMSTYNFPDFVWRGEQRPKKPEDIFIHIDESPQEKNESRVLRANTPQSTQ